MSNSSTILNNITETAVNTSTSLNINCIENDITTPGIPDKYDPLKEVLDILNYFNYVLLPTFLILGLTGNTLTVIIMNTKRFRHIVTRYLLVALAVSDALPLLAQPLNKMFIMKLFGRDFRALSNVGCKIFFVFFRTGKMTSSWFVVFLCFERFVAVWFPLKAKLICCKRNALIAVTAVYVVIGSFNISWAYCSKIIQDVCYSDVFDKGNPAEKTLYRNMLAAACSLYSLVPMCFMVVLTPLIIWKLAKHRQKRRQMTSAKSNADAVKTTAMLLGIVVAYVILITPVTTLHIIAFHLGIKAFGNNGNGFLIFRDVAQILEQLNYSINFFLYILTSKQFRVGLFELFCFKCFVNISSTHKTKSSEQCGKNVKENNYKIKKSEEPERGEPVANGDTNHL